jgi:hypothetical protein
LFPLSNFSTCIYYETPTQKSRKGILQADEETAIVTGVLQEKDFFIQILDHCENSDRNSSTIFFTLHLKIQRIMINKGGDGMIKLVALDLDGTLLDENREIPEDTKARLNDLKNQGIIIVLATGRTFESAKRYYYELGLDTPLIGCNGGVIYQPNRNELIQGAAFTKEDFYRVVSALTEIGVYYQYYGLHCIYTKRLDFGVKRWKCENTNLPKEWQMQIRVVEDPLLWTREEYHPIYKILARSSSQEKLDEVVDVVERMEGIDTVSSFALGLDIGPADCDKGKALEVVGKVLGIEREEMMAMGDNDNDQEMIRYAGIGIAMGDATKAAKQAADYCMNVNDCPGVLQALDRFL